MIEYTNHVASWYLLPHALRNNGVQGTEKETKEEEEIFASTTRVSRTKGVACVLI